MPSATTQTHAPYEQRPRGQGGEGKREAGVPFHIRRWHTVYLGSEEAARASPRTRSLPFLGDPRRRGGSEGESRSLTTAGGSETLRPDARVPPGPALSTRARSSRRRRGRGLLGAPPPVQSRGLGRGCGPPTESAPRARCPRPVPGGGRCARSGIPERPAPGPVPFLPASLLALGAAFRLVAPGCGVRGGAGLGSPEPGRRGAEREAGGNAPARRLEQGVCRLRSRRRALVPATLPRGGGKDDSSPSA